MQSRLFVIALALALATACGEVKSNLADATQPDAEEQPADAAGPDAQACSGAMPCPGDGICVEGVCFGCVESSTCGGETPVCDTGSHECRGCAQHGECPSEVCDLASGACIAADRAVYIAPNGGDAAGCGTQQAPCKSFATAIGKLTAPRNRLRILSGTYTTVLPLPGGGPWVVIGEGATLDGATMPAATEQIVSVAQGGSVTIDSLTFSNARDKAIACELGTLTLTRVTINNSVGSGMIARGCAVRVERSTLKFNNEFSLVSFDSTSGAGNGKLTIRESTLDGNAGGGIDFSGLLDVRDTLFARNGKDYNSAIRGHGSSTETVIAYNTFFENQGVYVNVVDCSGPGTVTSNAFYKNVVDFSSGFYLAQCGTVTRNWLDRDVRNGTNNTIGTDPGFVSSAADDFHPKADSALRDMGDPQYATQRDRDGRARPVGAGPDIGAYERQ